MEELKKYRFLSFAVRAAIISIFLAGIASFVLIFGAAGFVIYLVFILMVAI